jgi:hypothetical protein
MIACDKFKTELVTDSSSNPNDICWNDSNGEPVDSNDNSNREYILIRSKRYPRAKKRQIIF